MRNPVPKMATKLEFMTPTRADKILANNPENRNFRPHWVEKLTRIILNGEWKVTHQGIAINCDGTLIDGQHRLRAIVKSGKGVWINVTRKASKEATLGIDQGRTRSAHDLVKWMDLGFDFGMRHASTARMIMCIAPHDSPVKNTEPTNQQTISFVVKHKEAIGFACSLHLGDMNFAPTRAVLARAWYTQDRTRITEFAQVVHSGIPFSPDEDVSAILLRNWYGRDASLSAHGEVMRGLIYSKVELALAHFLKRKKIMVLQSATSELFPLPEEAE